VIASRRLIAQLATVALALVSGALAGCGSGASHPSRPPAAEPLHDARPQPHPAGHSVRVGTDPQGIAVDPAAGVVAVGVRGPAGVVLLSAASGHIVRRIRLAAPPRHLELAGADGPFLIPEEGADTLLELAEPSGRQRPVRVGAFPHDAASAGGRIYVADERGASITEVTPEGRTRTLRGFTQPGGVAADGADVAVVDVGAFTLTLLRASSGTVLGRLAAGRGPTHVAAAGGRIYVVDTRGDRVITYGTVPFRRLGETPVPAGPYGIAIDPAHRRLWVTETGANRLVELSLAGSLPETVRTYATQLQPDTVAADPRTGRVFVANQVSGTVEIIDPAA
jgi:DNA-binding beta-propeller fold protein YncE